jgi:hypothetical protein
MTKNENDRAERRNFVIGAIEKFQQGYENRHDYRKDWKRRSRESRAEIASLIV